VDDLRGTPMSEGTLEEIIDDNHAIVSTSVGSEHYVSILSFVDKDLLEPGCSVLLNHKVSSLHRSTFSLDLPTCPMEVNHQSTPGDGENNAVTGTALL
jgi:ATP-dependent 26S proteasome regulatory subunit